MNYDVIIVGSGLIGMSLAHALAKDFSCLLLDEKREEVLTHSTFDARSLALSRGSCQILKTLRLWDVLLEHVTPIHEIHVSNKGCFGATRMKDDIPFGHVIDINILYQKLQQALPVEKKRGISIEGICPKNATLTYKEKEKTCTVKASLIIITDASSKVRHLLDMPATVNCYEQEALVANISLRCEHQYKAYECFTQEGLMAFLPLAGKKVSLVWTLPKEILAERMQLKDEFFLKILQRQFGYRLGYFKEVGRRESFPLKLTYMPKKVKERVVFIGSAAHTLHPVAGQGFNLGLRDVAHLAQVIYQQGLSLETLSVYEKKRALDEKIVMHFTDNLVKIFTLRLPFVRPLQGLALMAIDNTPFFKKTLIRYAMGLGGIVSDLACGLPLEKA